MHLKILSKTIKFVIYNYSVVMCFIILIKPLLPDFKQTTCLKGTMDLMVRKAYL